MAKQESTVIRGWSNKVAKMPPKVALIVVLYKMIFYVIAQTSLIFLGCFCKEQIGCQELFLKLPNLVTLQESQKFLECKSGYFDHGVPCFDASWSDTSDDKTVDDKKRNKLFFHFSARHSELLIWAKLSLGEKSFSQKLQLKIYPVYVEIGFQLC